MAADYRSYLQHHGVLQQQQPGVPARDWSTTYPQSGASGGQYFSTGRPAQVDPRLAQALADAIFNKQFNDNFNRNYAISQANQRMQDVNRAALPAAVPVTGVPARPWQETYPQAGLQGEYFNTGRPTANPEAATAAAITAPNPGGYLAPIAEGASALVNDPKSSLIEAGKVALEQSSRPIQWSHGEIGDAAYSAAKGGGIPTWLYLSPPGYAFYMGYRKYLDENPKEAQEIIDAHDKGGGVGVWEDVIAAASNDLPFYVRDPLRIITDFVTDPLGIPLMVGGEVGGVARIGAKAAGVAGEVNKARILETTGRLLEAPQEILNVPFEAATWPIRKGAHLIGDKLGGLFREADRGVGAAADSTVDSAKTYDTLHPEMPENDLNPPGEPPMTPPDPTPPSTPPTPTAPQPPGQAPLPPINLDTMGPQVLPPEENNLGFLDPRKQTTMNGGVPQSAANLGRHEPEAAQRFWQRLMASQETQDFLRRQEAFDKAPSKTSARNAGAGGIFLDTAEQVLDQTRHEVDQLRPTYAQEFGEHAPPRKMVHSSRGLDEVAANPIQGGGRTGTTYTGRANINNLIERAVYGSPDDARLARQYLRVQAEMPGIPPREKARFQELADEVKRLRQKLYDDGYHSVEFDKPSSKPETQRVAKIRPKKMVQEADGTLREPTLVESPPKLQPEEGTPRPTEGVPPTAPSPLDQEAEPGPRTYYQTPPERKLPPPEEGIGPLKRFTDVLYRETDARAAEELIPTGRTISPQLELSFSNSPDLALGQGTNKGVLLEFDPSGIQGSLSRKKPAWRSSYESSNTAEFVSRGATYQREFKDALRSITVKAGAKFDRVDSARLKAALSRLEGSGWFKTVNEDGSITYRRPVADVPPGANQGGGVILQDALSGAATRASRLLPEPSVTTHIPEPVPGTNTVADAFNAGAIDEKTYADLTRMVVYRRTPMPLYEAYDMMVMEANGDVNAARKTLRSLIIATGLPSREATRKASLLARTYDAASGALGAINRGTKEMTQYNVARGYAGIAGDTIFDFFTALVSGHPGAAFHGLNPRNWMRWYRYNRGALNAIDEMPALQRVTETGAKIPHEITNSFHRDDLTGEGMMAPQKIAKAVGADNKVGNAIAGTFASIITRDLRHAGDANRRAASFVDQFWKEMPNARVELMDMAKTRATQLGLDPGEWIQKARSIPLSALSPESVRQEFNDEAMSRGWQRIIGDVTKAANDAQEKRLFSYRMTKADDMLRKVLWFHYWQTRALALHGQLALQNPWLLNTYVRGWHALQREAEDNGYPPSVVGYTKFMGSQFGFYGLFDPVSILTPFSAFKDMAMNEDGGKAWDRWMKRAGVFVNPMIEAAAHSLGWTDNAPDLTATRSVRRAAMAVVNWAGAHGMPGVDPVLHTDPVDRIEASTYDLINEKLAQPLGFTTHDIPPASDSPYDLSKINNVILTKMEEKYGPAEKWGDSNSPTWTEFFNARDNVIRHKSDGGGWADQAVKEWSNANLIGAGVKGVVPGLTTMRYGPRDERMMAAKEPGFAGDNAQMERDVASAGSPEAAKVVVQDRQWDQLGTIRQRSLGDAWNQIVYVKPEDLSGVMELHGRKYSGASLNQLTHEERVAIADEYISSYGGTQELEDFRTQQKQFKDEHPQYGEYKDYQTAIGDWDGGTAKFRSDMASQSPNFKRAMGEREDQIRQDTKDQKVVDAELDKWAFTTSAYEAASGYKSTVYDPAPLDINNGQQPAWKQTGDGGTNSNATSGTSSSELTRLKKDLAKYQHDVTLLDSVMKSAGMESLDQYQSEFMQPYLQQQFGDLMPTETSLMKAYWAWQQYNPAGTPEDFITYLDSIQTERAA